MAAKQTAPAPETPTAEPVLAKVEDAGLVEDVEVDGDDYESEDSLTFSNGVIEKIVAIACTDVPGVVGMKGGFINRMQETFTGTAPTKGVSVEVMPDNSVRVNISILMEYGAYAPQVFEDVKRAVVAELGGMTGLEVSGVNLRIEDVVVPGETPEPDEDNTTEDGE